jgi:hypothetical protein
VLTRLSILLVITGAALLGMGWVDPLGPLLLLAGAGCAAIVLEDGLDRAPAQPDRVAPTPVVADRALVDRLQVAPSRTISRDVA